MAGRVVIPTAVVLAFLACGALAAPAMPVAASAVWTLPNAVTLTTLTGRSGHAAVANASTVVVSGGVAADYTYPPPAMFNVGESEGDNKTMSLKSKDLLR